MQHCNTCGTNYTASQHSCVTEKICDTCQQKKLCSPDKRLSGFSTHYSSSDGYRHTCNICLEKQKRETQARSRVQYFQEKQKRAEENALLKQHGYYWRKHFDEEQGGDYWQLYTPQHTGCTVEEALQIIATQQAAPPQRGQALLKLAAWAHELSQHEPLLFLDTETTGLENDAEIIDLAIVDLSGDLIIDTLIQCQGAITDRAYRTHGLSKKDLVHEPTFPDIWIVAADLLADHDVVIYNAPFDMRLLRQTTQRYNYTLPATIRPHCLLQQYSNYIGESDKGGGIRRQPLSRACGEFGVQNRQQHRASSDALATRDVFLKLVELHRELQQEEPF